MATFLPRCYKTRRSACVVAAVFGVASAVHSPFLHAQAVPRNAEAASEFLLILEAFAGGVQYARFARGGWFAGVAASAGPSLAVTITEEASGDVREWATAWPMVGFRADRVRVSVSPIGAAPVVGNDFGAVYPAGQAGVDFVHGRLRAGSAIRVIRIAGGNGTGIYRTLWIPIRLGIALF